uniref:1,8-cineole synthase n=1 Tax=Artemisia annua TaxID=35608 RepID=A0A068L889_ARTAN|nr:1,8-cineole synthase [Artemisia annua]
MALTFSSSSYLLHNNSFARCTARHQICKPKRLTQGISNRVATVEPLGRRSANYEPSLWSFDHVQSLSSKYTGKNYVSRADSLKKIVKTMIHEVGNPSTALELVDDLQRLGIWYHFEDEISNVLEMIYRDFYDNEDRCSKMDMNFKALSFRLLRQHGYHVPQEIFHNFKEKTQNLKPYLHEDMVVMLNIYEASYYSYEDESIMDDARDFTAKYLKENHDSIDESISSLVSHALEFPLHWRIPREEAKWFIEFYEKRSGRNPTLIELAKLDFNMVQSIHLEDLKHASRWWRNTCWDKELPFARDRLMENFLWTVGVNYLPRFSLGRRTLTKVNAMITTIDDVYDVFGTIDELEKFTEVTNRWDINAVEELPDYMQICFIAFYNSINEIAYNTLTDTKFLILQYLKKGWVDLCNSYLKEAQWYESGYVPTLEEYLENAYVSISAPVILTHVNFLTTITSKEEILQFMETSDNIVRYSSLILRLADDLGTSSLEMARGDVPKSIQCYMHESGASEDEARMHIKDLILETWKKFNKEREHVKSKIAREFTYCAMNLGRMAQFMYREGDGHGHLSDVTKSHVLSWLINPIQGM